MSAATCGACGFIHETTWTRAIGRFNSERVTTYRAEYPESPIRNTRIECERDMCNKKAGK